MNKINLSIISKNIKLFKHLLIGILVFSFLLFASCKTTIESDIYTSDIRNFWQAYDSVLTKTDRQEQIELMQRLYVNKGTSGLDAFMELRNFNAEKLVKAVNDYPRFWKSIRPNTLKVDEKLPELSQYIKKLKTLYPTYREAKIYFTITAIRSGGTTKDSLVLVGTEIATGNAQTDVSEFPDKRLETFFKNQKEDNIIPFTIHEYVHTQQKSEGTTLLGQSIYEGACDFITELVLEKKLEHAYLVYGRKKESAVKERFKEQMWGENWEEWLYNGNQTKSIGDLGYYMGYTICNSFYSRAEDKKQAISTIIELDYNDENEISKFLEQSEYYGKK